MYASLQGHEGAVLALLEAGAAVDSKNNDWSTALMRASEYGHKETMRVLLEAGGNGRHTDQDLTIQRCPAATNEPLWVNSLRSGT